MFNAQTTAALKATAAGHTFIVTFDLHPESLNQAERQLGAWASDKALPFDWHDAANLSAVVRKFRERAKGQP